MRLSALILKWWGWKVDITIPDYPKCLICVAPHTSNWDFIIGKLAYSSIGRTAGFLMKDTWFFWPMGAFFRALGGIPVPRRRPKGQSLTDVIIDKYRSSERLTLAITPEGTRSRNAHWHTGFLRIAREANVPLALGVLDFGNKHVIIDRIFEPTGDMEADMRAVKDFYAPYKGKYPEKFTTE